MSQPVKSTIAKAIREADTSYFSEDYEKQAAAVLRALEKAGMVLMPKEANPDVYKKVSDLIPTGRMRPDELVRHIYSITVNELKVK